MAISSSPPASVSVDSAADRATDAALAKATAKLAADRKAKSPDALLRTDQKAVAVATKAAQKADSAAKTNSSKVNVTA